MHKWFLPTVKGQVELILYISGILCIFYNMYASTSDKKVF